jgi:hypothetical protein
LRDGVIRQLSDSIVGLLPLALKGGAAVAAVYWLTSRRGVSVRLAGAMVATAVFAYCSFIGFALIADNVGDLWRNLRVGGALALTLLASIAMSTGVVAYSNLRRRRLFAPIS